MPQTIEDLGKKVKAKYPGSYDDIPDIELGKKVKAKYPGSYDDFVDTVSAPQLDRQKLLEQHQKNLAESNPSMMDRAKAVAGTAIPAMAKSIINAPKAAYEMAGAASEDLLNVLSGRDMNSLTNPKSGQMLQGMIEEGGTMLGDIGAVVEDPSMPLSQYKKGAEAVGSIAGMAATPSIIKGVAKGASKTIPPIVAKTSVRMMDSLIRPHLSDVQFGKTPAATMVKHDLAATSMDGLLSKTETKLSELSEGVKQQLTSPSNSSKLVSIEPALKAIDSQIEQAVKRGKKALADGLQNLKDSLTHDLSTSKKKPLKVSPYEAQKIKDWIGDDVSWTEDAVEKGINQGKVAAYRALNNEIDKVVPGTKAANSDIADLISAKKAIDRRALIMNRNNILGVGDVVGGITGDIAGNLFGGHGIEGAVGGIILKRLLGSTGGKTYLAKLLGDLAPESLNKLTRQSKLKLDNPAPQLLVEELEKLQQNIPDLYY